MSIKSVSNSVPLAANSCLKKSLIVGIALVAIGTFGLCVYRSDIVGALFFKAQPKQELSKEVAKFLAELQFMGSSSENYGPERTERYGEWLKVKDKMTPAMQRLFQEKPNEFKALLNKKNGRGETPLETCEKDPKMFLAIANVMEELGLLKGFANNYGYNVLMLALTNQSGIGSSDAWGEVIRELLKKDCAQEWLDYRGENNTTPLHLAFEWNCVELVDHVLNLKAEKAMELLQRKAMGGNTPLHRAAWGRGSGRGSNSVGVVTLLLSGYVKEPLSSLFEGRTKIRFDQAFLEKLLKEKNDRGLTPLATAGQQHHVDMILAIVKKTDDAEILGVKFEYDGMGTTILHLAYKYMKRGRTRAAHARWSDIIGVCQNKSCIATLRGIEDSIGQLPRDVAN